MVLLNDVLKQSAAIKQIAQRHGAHGVAVFGSVARGESTDASDLDLIVDLDDDRSLLDRIALKQALEEFLGSRVDVMNRKSLHPALREQILRECVGL